MINLIYLQRLRHLPRSFQTPLHFTQFSPLLLQFFLSLFKSDENWAYSSSDFTCRGNNIITASIVITGSLLNDIKVQEGLNYPLRSVCMHMHGEYFHLLTTNHLFFFFFLVVWCFAILMCARFSCKSTAEAECDQLLGAWSMSGQPAGDQSCLLTTAHRLTPSTLSEEMNPNWDFMSGSC